MGTTAYRFAPEYELPSWPFRPPAELADPGTIKRHPVVIVGGGLAGLTLACDLAQRGVAAVLLDEDDTVGVRGASSRGICYAQKSLETFARLGTYERIREKGVTWSVGHTWSGDTPVYSFDLQTDSHSLQPPFINIQQFYIEWFLVERILELGVVDLRWKNKLLAIEPSGHGVRLDVETPAGRYAIEADWLIDATGANSPIRQQMGLDAHASRSDDRWCITDVRFSADLPSQRWTWVDAQFNEGRAVWQHPMADGVWRLDYQMGASADPEAASKPEVACERIRAQLGADIDFEFVWIGPYQYRDHLLDRFRHGRVVFIGDSAHVVCPFGARGGNTGIQDANNLGWKLAAVLRGDASEALIDSYDEERRAAAVENLQVTSRTSHFLAPRSHAEHVLRRAAIGLAREHAFARALVNAGRMSAPNDAPPGLAFPSGRRSVPNVQLKWIDGRVEPLHELLKRAPLGATLRFGAAGEGVTVEAAGSAGSPLGTLLDGDPPLAALLEAAPGGSVWIGPDAYRASSAATCFTSSGPR